MHRAAFGCPRPSAGWSAQTTSVPRFTASTPCWLDASPNRANCPLSNTTATSPSGPRRYTRVSSVQTRSSPARCRKSIPEGIGWAWCWGRGPPGTNPRVGGLLDDGGSDPGGAVAGGAGAGWASEAAEETGTADGGGTEQPRTSPSATIRTGVDASSLTFRGSIGRLQDRNGASTTARSARRAET